MELKPNLTRLVVCSPGTEYFLDGDTARHNITCRSDPKRAVIQHRDLITILRDSRVGVSVVGELANHPNSVFTRDASLVTPDGYIMLNMGLESRRGEEQWMAGHLESLGIKCAGAITGQGTVEGGDVILSGSIAFIGLSRRTNAEGAACLSAILNKMNFEVRMFAVPAPYLHLGGAMSVLSPDEVLCCRDIFPPGFFKGFRRLEIPADNFVSGNVISIGNHEVIAELGNTAAIQILGENGYHVHSPDLSEFIKGTGGPSCLVLPF